MESLITTIITLIIVVFFLLGVLFVGVIIFINFLLYSQNEDKNEQERI